MVRPVWAAVRRGGEGGMRGPMLERLAARALARPSSPTADLYLLGAFGDAVGPGGAVRRLGPGVFASAETLLVVRHAGRAEPLPRRRRLLWLIDDDVEAAVADPGLPPGQRLKLALLERGHGRRLLRLGAEVVASSAALADRYRGRAPVHLLAPHWSLPLAAPSEPAGRLRIAYLGSAVHRGDLAFLAPALRRLLDARPELELHLAANHRAAPLAGHPQVRPIRATAWPDYRRWLAGRRFDIAVYPLLDTAVNRARSVNKLIEHAIVGAAGLYSGCWPEARRVARRGAGLVLANRAEDWAEAIEALAADARLRRRLALAGRALAADLNHPGRARAFWRHAFALPDPSEGTVGPAPSRRG